MIMHRAKPMDLGEFGFYLTAAKLQFGRIQHLTRLAFSGQIGKVFAAPAHYATMRYHVLRIGAAMPKGPQGQRRPADVNGCAVMVAKLATGEINETLTTPSGKIRSGHASAKARAAKQTPHERRAIAKKAAEARWR
jgi:hypothetical protein